jgi:hypothetical protein
MFLKNMRNISKMKKNKNEKSIFYWGDKAIFIFITHLHKRKVF